MLTVASHGADALDTAMDIMARAFDPRFGEAWTASQCAGVLSMPGAHLLIARAESPQGFALIRSIAGESELMLLAVDPPHRGVGVGRTLLRASFDVAQANGAETMFLEVRSDNPAIKLYSDEGLGCVGQRRGYYRGSDGELRDALTFRKSLTSKLNRAIDCA